MKKTILTALAVAAFALAAPQQDFCPEGAPCDRQGAFAPAQRQFAPQAQAPQMQAQRAAKVRQYMQNHPEARQRVQQFMQNNPQARQAVQQRMAQGAGMQAHQMPMMQQMNVNPVEQAYGRGFQAGFRMAMQQCEKMQGKGSKGKEAGCADKMGAMKPGKGMGAMAGKGKGAMTAKGGCEEENGACEMPKAPKQAGKGKNANGKEAGKMGAMKPGMGMGAMAGKGKGAMAAKGGCEEENGACEMPKAPKQAGKGKNAKAAKGECEEIKPADAPKGEGEQRRRGRGGNGAGNHEEAGFSANIFEDEFTALTPAAHETLIAKGGKGNGNGGGKGQQKRLKKKDGSGDGDGTCEQVVEETVLAKGCKGCGNGDGSGDKKRQQKKDGDGTCQESAVA